MTGRELIEYIQEGNLQDKRFFIDVEGYFSNIGCILENDKGDIILAESDSNINDYKSDLYNRERYFSEWFDIIPFDEGKKRWDDGDKTFLVLREDGTECYAECYGGWEEIEDLYTNSDALFGLER